MFRQYTFEIVLCLGETTTDTMQASTVGQVHPVHDPSYWPEHAPQITSVGEVGPAQSYKVGNAQKSTLNFKLPQLLDH